MARIYANAYIYYHLYASYASYIYASYNDWLGAYWTGQLCRHESLAKKLSLALFTINIFQS